MQQKLTAKQQRVLDFLGDYISLTGYPPTVRELAEKLCLAGPNSAKKFLDILERKGYILRQPGRSRAIEMVDSSRPHATCSFPVAGCVRAGQPMLAVEDIEQYIAVDPSFVRGEGLFFLRVKGNSMIDAHIKDGDLALIRPQPEVASGDIAAVLIDEEATLKYFYKEKNRIRLQPANSAFDPIIFNQNDAALVQIIGKAVAVMRNME